MMFSRISCHPKGKRKAGDGIMGAIPAVLLGFVILMGCTVLWAQEPKSAEKSVPAVKTHDPLGGKACVDCHKRAASPSVKCLLAKVELCESCHEIPAKGGPARLVDSSEPLCVQCHKKEQFKGSIVHGPFAVRACIACHDPHGGDVPGMLRSTGSQMCLDCHKDVKERMGNARFRHKAAETECIDCHSPHASEQKYVLTSAVPGLCGKCHEKIIKDQQTAKVQHSPVTEAPACMNCHDPHEAQESALLRADGLDICLKCHDKKVKSGDQEFADMKQLLAAKPFPHGPIQYRDCSTCHNPHGSPNFRILTDQHPKGFYAAFSVSNYDLCFRCHDAALAKEERTTTATEFRDGDRNLHFVHVNRTSRGRTCRSCHEVHASSLPKQIAKIVQFGRWELPIKYEKTENGGSCTPGCHVLLKYDREQAKLEKR